MCRNALQRTCWGPFGVCKVSHLHLYSRAWVTMQLCRCMPMALMLVLCPVVIADVALNVCAADPISPETCVQQQMQTGNCNPPRSPADTQEPFCYLPETLSPEARQFLATASAAALPFKLDSRPDKLAASLAWLRSGFATMSSSVAKLAEDLYVHSSRNDTFGGVPVLVTVPKGVTETEPANTEVLLYLHGGAYILGSCHFQLGTPIITAVTAGLTIICPEYRLAPEHPFPAALTDVVTAYKSMLQQQYQARNIVILGDSAGGGLVAAVAIQLQREGIALPAALGMFSPWSDMRNRGDSAKTLIGVDPMFDGDSSSSRDHPKGTDLAAALYLVGNASHAGDLHLLDDPLASPVEADYVSLFLQGTLPPTLIQVGLREQLLSDAVRLFLKMKGAARAPGRVMLTPYEGMWHVFQTFFNVPEAVAASKEMAEHFVAALNGLL